MKFKFKIQDYQTDAVDSVVNCFSGQKLSNSISYRRDIGEVSKNKEKDQIAITESEDYDVKFKYDGYIDEIGFKNKDLSLSPSQLLENIKNVQQNNNLIISDYLKGNIGACSLDIEMETGTGKTYVYIKTMYELNKKYGWSKFIIIVPSIAIREGVKKSFEITEDHFMENYGKKIRYFVYDSANLNQLDSFSSDSGINVMIINMQAFNSSFKESRRPSNTKRIIYSRRDEFGSRRPIDVIASNRPILILDEPQKMGGKATQESLKNFNPLFTLNYSATHKKNNNLVYALDAVDAYNQKLVKKIEVKGFQVKNFRGTDKYLYLDSIVLSPKHPPKAKIEFEIAYNKSINRENRILSEGDNLYELSKNMEQYKGYTISEINASNGTVTFLNGEVINTGEVVGDVSEKDIRRVQIRETIKSHLEKEESLFDQGIKTLSLFFIDEVAKYRQYDEDGNELTGEYSKVFEEEYNSVVNEYSRLEDTPYQRYLKNIRAEYTHKGYFSIDKKGRAIDGDIKSDGLSVDTSAYDLILKNKERLLSFDEPTRFIFSHSALREGWDNPNVFQICTLKQGSSTTMKRQEVGRGLRICVDKYGNRMDKDRLSGSLVHKINKLTVIASESYKDFVSDLQKELKDNLYERPRKASIEYFEGKRINLSGEIHKISSQEARLIYQYMLKNDYVSMDEHERVTKEYHADLENNSLAPLPESLEHMKEGVHQLIQSVFNEEILKAMFSDGNKTKTSENDLNENFYKKEFQTLWSYINHKYTYTVDFDSDELIEKSIKSIDDNLFVTRFLYTTSVSEQKDVLSADDVKEGQSFDAVKSRTETIKHSSVANIKYDLIGKIAEKTSLTRKTVVKILKGIRFDKFAMYKENPEEFISKVSKLIIEQKATMIVEHISYDKIDGKYDSSIFTAEKHVEIEKAFKAEKHIQPYVFTDGIAEDSIEKKFAKSLDSADEVCVYAKLPQGFSIPTPVGNYSPDWAIAFNEGSVKHIYFIAETKGSMESMQLRTVEQAKILCAKKLFNEISTDNVVYHEVDSYESLLDIMPRIDKKVVNG